ncbi:MAG: Nif3-like dinuclear metal center hexameric protein [Bryobacteraceae bacterium]|nr:Nif3-like dinuclear metal center hexameric protein [Bryobacteraceae bacterium]
MNPTSTRRPFILGGIGLSLHAAMQSEPLTAAAIIDKIKVNIGVPWREKTVDNLIAGSPATPIKGIATTMMATLDVLQRAHAAGRNMVITHESTFFSHQDSIDQLREDKTYLYKLNFIEKNNMAVFHFHDHWHARRPDGIATGMMRDLGWEKNVDPENPRRYQFPGIPLARFAASIEKKLNIRTMRVLGDPKLPVNRVMTSWGYVSQFPGATFIARPDVDVLVAGETREWELVEYVQDMISSGQKKALIIMGHVVSEQSGMRYCAEWLRGFLKDVPIDFIPAAEPFWRPAEPVG